MSDMIIKAENQCGGGERRRKRESVNIIKTF
jgi:hypothetical protein